MKNDINPVELERRKEKSRLKKKQKKNSTNKRNFTQVETSIDTSKLGPKSIFYDPEWNPYGEVPLKYRERYQNLTYHPSKTHILKPVSEAESEILKATKIPSGEPPRFYKRADAQVSYENEEELKLVPTSILRKKLKKQ